MHDGCQSATLGTSRGAWVREGKMKTSRSWNLLYAATFALPLILAFASVRTFREMDAQREVYLRDRAAGVAGRLDAAGAQDGPIEAAIASLAESEPHLRDLKVLTRGADGRNPELEAVWDGRELFHTDFVWQGGARVYRAFVPFHVHGEMRVAQIDLDRSASDFLVVHARHNVIISVVGGVALLLISLYSIYAARRTAALERRQLELQHLARLGAMSAVLAHEIRNPLGTIKGFAQLALEQASGGLTALLTPITEQTRRLETLVNDLLVYGRPPSPSPRKVAWAEIAARLTAHGSRLTEGRVARLNVAGADIQLQTDPDLLEHILVNLTRNALDAVDGLPDGCVLIDAALRDGGVTVAVRDNGPGVPDAEIPKIREPFYTTKASGTGLGLPISIRLTHALGGVFDIHNDEAGGTVATVTLPAER